MLDIHLKIFHINKRRWNIMKNTQVILYDCPLCDEVHEVNIIQNNVCKTFKEVELCYDETLYHCNTTDEYFTPSKILSQNLLNMKDSYRSSQGLLTSHDIKEIRETYSLTQRELALALGWGEITIQRYEKKKIQDSTYDSVLRLFREDQLFALNQLKSNRNSFEETRFNEIYKRIIDVIKNSGVSYHYIKELETLYAEFDQINDSNGCKLLDLDKLNSVVGYFSANVENLFKVRLMKMLWYADSISYKKYGHSLTGLVYYHEKMGALPIGHDSIIKLPSIEVEYIYFDDDKEGYKIVSRNDLSLSKFNSDELEILADVTRKFKSMKTRDIVDYMHEEDAYTQTKNKQIISFQLAKKIRAF